MGPERTARATVRFGSITVSPPSACIEPGEDLQLEAEVTGLENKAVSWNADIGSINQQGRYTAPSDATPGTVATVTATSVESPGLSGKAIVVVGGCTCSWEGLVDGVPFEGMDGDAGEFKLTAGGTAIESLTVERGDASGSIVAAFTTLGDPAIPVGAVGAFPVFVSGQGELANGTMLGYHSASEDGSSVEAEITRNEPGVLGGIMTGTVTFIEPIPEGKVASFYLSFVVTRDPLDSSETVSRCVIGGVQGGGAP